MKLFRKVVIDDKKFMLSITLLSLFFLALVFFKVTGYNMEVNKWDGVNVDYATYSYAMTTLSLQKLVVMSSDFMAYVYLVSILFIARWYQKNKNK
jgi:hypothetical protein